MVVLLSVIIILQTKPSAAETSGITDEKLYLIQSCEKIFPDLEKLGNLKFRQRYQHFTNFQNCTILYNNPIWYSNATDRIEKLAGLLDKSILTKPVRDRFDQNQVIPEWIKDDAKRWQLGKEKDNIFSYGIRFMINSNMIPAPISISDLSDCENRICVAQNDFLKYSIKDTSIQDVITLTHTFQNVGEDSMIITTDEVSKSDKTTNNIKINKDGFVTTADQKCCKYYQFVHKIPMQLGAKVDSNSVAQLTDEIIFSFKDQKRSALIAKDRTGSYYEVIDKQTGVVFFIKHQDKIKKTVWIAELVDTNVFIKNIKIEYDGMRIPPWFKTVVKWWTEGKITDTEYVAGIGYLIKHDVLQV